MRGSLVHTLSSGFAGGGDLASQLDPSVLRYWSGRTSSSLALATDGTGAVAKGDGTAYLADFSAHGRPLIQAVAGNRPIAGLHAKGRGFSISPGPLTGRYLQAASALTGGRYFYAAISFVGPDTASNGPLPVAFLNASQGIVAGSTATDEASSAIIGLINTNTLWLPNGAGGLSGPSTIDGVATSNVGTWWRRRRVRVDRATDLSGALMALRDATGAMTTNSLIHELIVLSSSATADDHAKVAAWLEWHESTPVVALTADSLSVGYGLTFHKSVAGLLSGIYGGTVSTPCLGIPGQQADTAAAGDGVKLDAIKGAGANIVVLQVGSNDIYNGATAATTWARILAYLAMAKARGWQVVLCTIPDTALWVTVGKTAVVDTLNDLMRNNWEAEGFAALVDVGAPSVQVDGLHYDAAGAAAVAAQIAAVLDTML